MRPSSQYRSRRRPVLSTSRHELVALLDHPGFCRWRGWIITACPIGDDAPMSSREYSAPARRVQYSATAVISMSRMPALLH